MFTEFRRSTKEEAESGMSEEATFLSLAEVSHVVKSPQWPDAEGSGHSWAVVVDTPLHCHMEDRDSAYGLVDKVVGPIFKQFVKLLLVLTTTRCWCNSTHLAQTSGLQQSC